MSVTNTPKEDGKARYNAARAGFVSRGDTLGAWCRRSGTNIQNVSAAFFGEWKGPRASSLIENVERAATSGDAD